MTNKSMKPTINEQEWEQIMLVLMESLGLRVPARFHLFDKYEDCVAVGVVECVDPYLRRFSVESDWFMMANIIGAALL
jgi:hypothetical protein